MLLESCNGMLAFLYAIASCQGHDQNPTTIGTRHGNRLGRRLDETGTPLPGVHVKVS